MRIIAYGLIAIATALAAGIAAPVLVQPGAGWFDGATLVLLCAVYFGTFFTLAGALAHLFVRLALAPRQAELATRRALGETRGAIVAEAARGALRVGAAVALPAAVLGAVGRQLIPEPSTDPTSLADASVNWWSVYGVAIAGVLGIATAVIAVATATAAATRGTPDAVDRSSLADGEPAPRGTTGGHPRRRLAILRWVALAAIAYAIVLETFDRITPVDPWALQNLADPGWLMVAENVALIIAIPAVLWLTYAFGLWIAEAAAAVSGRVLARRSRSGAGAIAADALTGLTAAGRRTLGAAVGIIAIFAGAVAASGHSNAIDEATAEATPQLYVLSQPRPTAPVGSGWETVALDGEAVAAAAADARIHVLPLAQLRADPWEGEVWHAGAMAPELTSIQPVAFAVDLGANGHSTHALRRIGLMDGSILGGEAWSTTGDTVGYVSGPVTVEADGSSAPAYAIWTQLSLNHVDLAWAERAWGEAPVSALAVWPADGATARDVRDAVAQHFPVESAWTWDYPDHWGSVYWHGLSFVLVAFAFVIVVVLIASLAVTTARMRRRELATMAALGATPRMLAAAPMLQAAVLAAAATIGGVAVGVAFAVLANNPFLLSPGAPFDVGEITWHLGADLGAVPWLWIALAAGGTVAAAAIAGRVVGAAMAGGTPVEELRTAQKEGVR